MIKKYYLLLFAILLALPLISALEECQDVVTASTNCEVVTPVISCATYDLYNPSHSLDTDDGAMTQIGATGIYYFTFNEATAGDWTIHLCSNHTTEITIGTTDQVAISSVNSTLYNQINSVNVTLYTYLTSINNSITTNINTVGTNLISVNSTLYAHIDLTNNNLISVNGTLYNKIDGVNTSIMNKITAVNTSISTDIYNLNTNLLSVNGTLYTRIGEINSSITNSVNTVNTNLISINGTLYAEVDTLEENLTKYGSNVTWIGDSVWNYAYRTIDFSNSTGSINATVTVNNTAIAGAVWDYNLTKAGYSTNNTGVAGSIQRYIALTVYWIERLLP